MMKTLFFALIFSLGFTQNLFAADGGDNTENCDAAVRTAAMQFLSEQNPTTPGLIAEIRMVLFHGGYLQYQVEVIQVNQLQPEHYLAEASGNPSICQVTGFALDQ
jgi:hypothetical protein